MSDRVVNIYLVQEDGESFCIQAETMSGAIAVCQNSYLDEIESDMNEGKTTLRDEIANYQRNILQGCTLIGELKNPDRPGD